MSTLSDEVRRVLQHARVSRSGMAVTQAFTMLTSASDGDGGTGTRGRRSATVTAMSTGVPAELYILCCEVAIALDCWSTARQCVNAFVGHLCLIATSTTAPTTATRTLVVRALYCQGMVQAHEIPPTLSFDKLIDARLVSAATVLQGLTLAVDMWPSEAWVLLDGETKLWGVAEPLYLRGAYHAVVQLVGYLFALHQRLMIGGPATYVQWATRYVVCLCGVGRVSEAMSELSAVMSALAVHDSKTCEDRMRVQLWRLYAYLLATLEGAAVCGHLGISLSTASNQHGAANATGMNDNTNSNNKSNNKAASSNYHNNNSSTNVANPSISSLTGVVSNASNNNTSSSNSNIGGFTSGSNSSRQVARAVDMTGVSVKVLYLQVIALTQAILCGCVRATEVREELLYLYDRFVDEVLVRNVNKFKQRSSDSANSAATHSNRNSAATREKDKPPARSRPGKSPPTSLSIANTAYLTAAAYMSSASSASTMTATSNISTNLTATGGAVAGAAAASTSEFTASAATLLLSSSSLGVVGACDMSLLEDVLSDLVLALTVVGEGGHAEASRQKLLHSTNPRARMFALLARTLHAAHEENAYLSVEMDACLFDSQSVTPNWVDAMLRHMRAIGHAIDGAGLVGDVSERGYAVHVGCVCLWNMCLPLLQSPTHAMLRPALHKLLSVLRDDGDDAAAAATVGSNALLCRAQYEIARLTMAEHNLSASARMLTRARASCPAQEMRASCSRHRHDGKDREGEGVDGTTTLVVAESDLTFLLECAQQRVRVMADSLSGGGSAPASEAEMVLYELEQLCSRFDCAKNNRGKTTDSSSSRRGDQKDACEMMRYCYAESCQGSFAAALETILCKLPLLHKKAGAESNRSDRRGSSTAAATGNAPTPTPTKKKGVALGKAAASRRASIVVVTPTKAFLSPLPPRELVYLYLQVLRVCTRAGMLVNALVDVAQPLVEMTVPHGRCYTTWLVSQAEAHLALACVRIATECVQNRCVQADVGMESTLTEGPEATTGHLIAAAELGIMLTSLQGGAGYTYLSLNALRVYLNWRAARFAAGSFAPLLPELVSMYTIITHLAEATHERLWTAESQLVSDVALLLVLAHVQVYVQQSTRLEQRNYDNSNNSRSNNSKYIGDARQGQHGHKNTSPATHSSGSSYSSPCDKKTVCFGHGGHDNCYDDAVHLLFLYDKPEANHPLLQRAQEVCVEVMVKVGVARVQPTLCMLYPHLCHLLALPPQLVSPPLSSQQYLLILLGQLCMPVSSSSATAAESVEDRRALLSTTVITLLRRDPAVALCGRVLMAAASLNVEHVMLEVCEMADVLYRTGRLGWGSNHSAGYDDSRLVYGNKSSNSKGNASTSKNSSIRSSNSSSNSSTHSKTRSDATGGAHAPMRVGITTPSPKRVRPSASDWLWYARLLLAKATMWHSYVTSCSDALPSRRRTRALEILMLCTNSAVAAARGPPEYSPRVIRPSLLLYHRVACSLRHRGRAVSRRLLPSLTRLLIPSVLTCALAGAVDGIPGGDVPSDRLSNAGPHRRVRGTAAQQEHRVEDEVVCHALCNLCRLLIACYSTGRRKIDGRPAIDDNSNCSHDNHSHNSTCRGVVSEEDDEEDEDSDGDAESDDTAAVISSKSTAVLFDTLRRVACAMPPSYRAVIRLLEMRYRVCHLCGFVVSLASVQQLLSGDDARTRCRALTLCAQHCRDAVVAQELWAAARRAGRSDGQAMARCLFAYACHLYQPQHGMRCGSRSAEEVYRILRHALHLIEGLVDPKSPWHEDRETEWCANNSKEHAECDVTRSAGDCTDSGKKTDSSTSARRNSDSTGSASREMKHVNMSCTPTGATQPQQRGWGWWWGSADLCARARSVSLLSGVHGCRIESSRTSSVRVKDATEMSMTDLCLALRIAYFLFRLGGEGGDVGTPQCAGSYNDGSDRSNERKNGDKDAVRGGRSSSAYRRDFALLMCHYVTCMWHHVHARAKLAAGSMVHSTAADAPSPSEPLARNANSSHTNKIDNNSDLNGDDHERPADSAHDGSRSPRESVPSARNKPTGPSRSSRLRAPYMTNTSHNSNTDSDTAEPGKNSDSNGAMDSHTSLAKHPDARDKDDGDAHEGATPTTTPIQTSTRLPRAAADWRGFAGDATPRSVTMACIRALRACAAEDMTSSCNTTALHGMLLELSDYWLQLDNQNAGNACVHATNTGVPALSIHARWCSQVALSTLSVMSPEAHHCFVLHAWLRVATAARFGLAGVRAQAVASLTRRRDAWVVTAATSAGTCVTPPSTWAVPLLAFAPAPLSSSVPSAASLVHRQTRWQFWQRLAEALRSRGSPRNGNRATESPPQMTQSVAPCPASSHTTYRKSIPSDCDSRSDCSSGANAWLSGTLTDVALRLVEALIGDNDEEAEHVSRVMRVVEQIARVAQSCGAVAVLLRCRAVALRCDEFASSPALTVYNDLSASRGAGTGTGTQGALSATPLLPGSSTVSWTTTSMNVPMPLLERLDGSTWVRYYTQAILSNLTAPRCDVHRLVRDVRATYAQLADPDQRVWRDALDAELVRWMGAHAMTRLCVQRSRADALLGVSASLTRSKTCIGDPDGEDESAVGIECSHGLTEAAAPSSASMVTRVWQQCVRHLCTSPSLQWRCVGYVARHVHTDGWMGGTQDEDTDGDVWLVRVRHNMQRLLTEADELGSLHHSLTKMRSGAITRDSIKSKCNTVPDETSSNTDSMIRSGEANYVDGIEVAADGLLGICLRRTEDSTWCAQNHLLESTVLLLYVQNAMTRLQLADDLVQRFETLTMEQRGVPRTGAGAALERHVLHFMNVDTDEDDENDTQNNTETEPSRQNVDSRFRRALRRRLRAWQTPATGILAHHERALRHFGVPLAEKHGTIGSPAQRSHSRNVKHGSRTIIASNTSCVDDNDSDHTTDSANCTERSVDAAGYADESAMPRSARHAVARTLWPSWLDLCALLRCASHLAATVGAALPHFTAHASWTQMEVRRLLECACGHHFAYPVVGPPPPPQQQQQTPSPDGSAVSSPSTSRSSADKRSILSTVNNATTTLPPLQSPCTTQLPVMNDCNDVVETAVRLMLYRRWNITALVRVDDTPAGGTHASHRTAHRNTTAASNRRAVAAAAQTRARHVPEPTSNRLPDSAVQPTDYPPPSQQQHEQTPKEKEDSMAKTVTTASSSTLLPSSSHTGSPVALLPHASCDLASYVPLSSHTVRSMLLCALTHAEYTFDYTALHAGFLDLAHIYLTEGEPTLAARAAEFAQAASLYRCVASAFENNLPSSRWTAERRAWGRFMHLDGHRVRGRSERVASLSHQQQRARLMAVSDMWQSMQLCANWQNERATGCCSALEERLHDVVVVSVVHWPSTSQSCRSLPGSASASMDFIVVVRHPQQAQPAPANTTSAAINNATTAPSVVSPMSLDARCGRVSAGVLSEVTRAWRTLRQQRRRARCSDSNASSSSLTCDAASGESALYESFLTRLEDDVLRPLFGELLGTIRTLGAHHTVHLCLDSLLQPLPLEHVSLFANMTQPVLRALSALHLGYQRQSREVSASHFLRQQSPQPTARSRSPAAAAATTTSLEKRKNQSTSSSTSAAGTAEVVAERNTETANGLLLPAIVGSAGVGTTVALILDPQGHEAGAVDRILFADAQGKGTGMTKSTAMNSQSNNKSNSNNYAAAAAASTTHKSSHHSSSHSGMPSGYHGRGSSAEVKRKAELSNVVVLNSDDVRRPVSDVFMEWTLSQQGVGAVLYNVYTPLSRVLTPATALALPSMRHIHTMILIADGVRAASAPSLFRDSTATVVTSVAEGDEDEPDENDEDEVARWLTPLLLLARGVSQVGVSLLAAETRVHDALARRLVPMMSAGRGLYELCNASVPPASVREGGGTHAHSLTKPGAEKGVPRTTERREFMTFYGILPTMTKAK